MYGRGCVLTGARVVGTEGVTALCHAAAQGHEEVVRQLLRHGASLEVADARGQTPLLWAVTQGHERVVQLLLRHGAKPDAATTAGNTAFHLACKVICKNVFNPEGMALLKAITDAGADTAKKNRNGFTGAEFLAGAGAHGAQWLAQLDRLLQPTEAGSATSSATTGTTALTIRGAVLPWVTELEGAVAAAPAREPVSRLAAESTAQATPRDPPINVLLSFRTDELSSFASKLHRALNTFGVGATTMPEIRKHDAKGAKSVDGRTVIGWVKGIGELLYSAETAVASMTVSMAGTRDAATAETKLATSPDPTEHHVARLNTRIRRLWSGLEDRALLRVLNHAAHQAAVIRARTSVTLVADAAATELLLRQLNHATASNPDTTKQSERATREKWFRKMLEGVSEVALLEHVGPCITAAEQRLSTSGVEGDSDAEAVQLASELLLESLDARDAERAAVRKRRRQVQEWTQPSIINSVNPSAAEKTAAIAAIGGVGGQAATERHTDITAEQARERKLLEKRQEVQHARQVVPLQEAAVSLQAAARGWMVRCCGGNASMPFDWHRYTAVCSVDAVVAVISRTFGMGDPAQCAAYGTAT